MITSMENIRRKELQEFRKIGKKTENWHGTICPNIFQEAKVQHKEICNLPSVMEWKIWV
jgi:hypothetical protein